MDKEYYLSEINRAYQNSRAKYNKIALEDIFNNNQSNQIDHIADLMEWFRWGNSSNPFNFRVLSSDSGIRNMDILFHFGDLTILVETIGWLFNEFKTPDDFAAYLAKQDKLIRLELEKQFLLT